MLDYEWFKIQIKTKTSIYFSELGIGAGLLRNLFYKSIELNIVCADFVTNGSLAIAWHTSNEYGRTQFEPKIYHINRVSDPTLIFGKWPCFSTQKPFSLYFSTIERVRE